MKKPDQQIVFKRFSWKEFEKHTDLIRAEFGTDVDPWQIPPETKYVKKVLRLSRNCVLYADFPDGDPVGSAFAFPTTKILMKKFKKKQISERELFVQTPIRKTYDAIYACSVMVIKPMRRKGIGKTLITKVLQTLLREYPNAEVFYFATTREGDALAKKLQTTAYNT